MKLTRLLYPIILILLAVSAVSCTSGNSNSQQETFVPSEDSEVAFGYPLSMEDFLEGSYEREWLMKCASPDRDDFFDAYVLRNESTADGNTTYTYLIYYPCKEHSLTLTAAPELLVEGDDRIIRLTYTESGDNAYALAYLSITLPGDTRPGISLIFDGEELGVLSTVTDQSISFPG